MAYPVILFNSSSGSDTEASGAGPSTAEYGTDGEWSGSTFTLGDMSGGPDLSGVATDGSHVIWVDTSTGRKFFAIFAKDESGFTVSVESPIAGDTTGLTWAIGGERASLKGSRMLFESESGSWGSYSPGAKYTWKAELADGYFETFGSGDVLLPNVAGETDGEGRFELRAEAGATTRPRLECTESAGYYGTIVKSDYNWGTSPKMKFTGIDFEYNNGSTSGYNYLLQWREDCFIDNCLFTKTGAGGCVAVYCYLRSRVRHCTFEAGGGSTRQYLADLTRDPIIEDSILRNSVGDGLKLQVYPHSATIKRCQVYDNNEIGIAVDYGLYNQLFISDCLVDGNGTDGIYLTGWTGIQSAQIENCQITNNGGYGVNQAGSNNLGQVVHYRNNNFHGNTSGESNITLTKFDCTVSAPGYTDAANGDFSASQGNDLGAPITPCGHDGADDASRWYSDMGVGQSSGGGGDGTPQLINGGLVS